MAVLNCGASEDFLWPASWLDRHRLAQVCHPLDIPPVRFKEDECSLHTNGGCFEEDWGWKRRGCIYFEEEAMR